MKRNLHKTQEQLLSISRLREVEEKIESIDKEFRKKQISDPEKIILDHFEFLNLFKISRRTSQNWRVRGRISHSLIGGRIYFTLADVQRLVEEHRVPIINSEFRIQNSPESLILGLSKAAVSADSGGSAGNSTPLVPADCTDTNVQNSADRIVQLFADEPSAQSTQSPGTHSSKTQSPK